MRRSLNVFVAAALACVAPVACHDGGSTSPPTPSIAITVSTSELAVMCGRSGSATVTLTRLGGFTGDVTISLEGLPDDVAATLAPAVLSGAATVTVVTVDASAAHPGSYAITVTASSSVGQASASYQLRLVEPPDFAISIMPEFELMRGQVPFLLPITIARTGGFGGAVALSLPGAPEGIVFDFIPPVVTGTGAMLSLGAGVTAPLGTVRLAVTGTADGLPSRQAVLVLTVTREEVTLSAAPRSITIARGGTGVVTIGIARAAGNTDGVEFLLPRAPTGITGVFTPKFATGSTAMLTLSVAATVPAGVYPLIVLGEYGYFVFAEVGLTVVVVEP